MHSFASSRKKWLTYKEEYKNWHKYKQLEWELTDPKYRHPMIAHYTLPRLPYYQIKEAQKYGHAIAILTRDMSETLVASIVSQVKAAQCHSVENLHPIPFLVSPLALRVQAIIT